MGFRIQDSGLTVQDFELIVWGFRLWVQGSGFRVQGLEERGLSFRVANLEVTMHQPGPARAPECPPAPSSPPVSASTACG